MRFATCNEIEYLSASDGRTANDEELVRELSRQLDALRRYDQYFCDEHSDPCVAPTNFHAVVSRAGHRRGT